MQLDAGLNLLGQQYVKVGEDTVALDIQEIISFNDMVGYDEFENPLTTIKIWNGLGYDSCYYLTLENAADWAETYGDPTYLAKAGKWIDGYEDVVACDFEKGTGFWIQTTTSSTIIFAGQVYSPTNATISLVAGLNLISNPFPVDWNVQNFYSPDMVGYDEFEDPLTTLQIWNGIGYESCYYLTPENASDWAETYGDPSYLAKAGKWIDGYEDVVSFSVAPGKAFWIITGASATMLFTR